MSTDLAANELPKQYDHAAAQSRWYPFWEERGYFHSEPDPTAKPYTIVIPPPNVTGALHLGHALNNTLQDILIRWQADAGLQDPVDARHRSRRHRHAGGRRAAAAARKRS